MRQYRIASWILLIHSIINFTLAAPVVVGDINRVRVNVVHVAKDGMAVLRERMDHNEDPDDGQSSDLTSEHGPPGPGPESESESNSEMVSESDSNSEMVSESESESESDDSDGGEAAQQWEEELQNYEPSDAEEEDEGHEEDSNEEDNHEDDNHEGDDSEEDDHKQGPPQSPESHPAASTYDDLWSKILKGSMRPRDSTSGAIDASKGELQEKDNTRAYVCLYSPNLPTSK